MKEHIRECLAIERQNEDETGDGDEITQAELAQIQAEINADLDAIRFMENRRATDWFDLTRGAFN